MRYLGVFLLMFLVLGGCAKKKAKKQAETDDAIILQYISDHGLTATKTATSGTGLVTASGTPAIAAGTITIGYKF